MATYPPNATFAPPGPDVIVLTDAGRALEERYRNEYGNIWRMALAIQQAGLQPLLKEAIADAQRAGRINEGTANRLYRFLSRSPSSLNTIVQALGAGVDVIGYAQRFGQRPPPPNINVGSTWPQFAAQDDAATQWPATAPTSAANAPLPTGQADATPPSLVQPGGSGQAGTMREIDDLRDALSGILTGSLQTARQISGAQASAWDQYIGDQERLMRQRQASLQENVARSIADAMRAYKSVIGLSGTPTSASGANIERLHKAIGPILYGATERGYDIGEALNAQRLRAQQEKTDIARALENLRLETASRLAALGAPGGVIRYQ